MVADCLEMQGARGIGSHDIDQVIPAYYGFIIKWKVNLLRPSDAYMNAPVN